MPRRKGPCPDLAAHTPEPPNITVVGWDLWAEAMSATHDQVRCKGCGLFAIWAPKVFKRRKLSVVDAIKTAEAMAHGILPESALDDLDIEPHERESVVAVAHFIGRSERLALRRRAQRPQQAKALALLRSYLTPEQRRQLAASRAFYVDAPSGERYRLYPSAGSVSHVARHGKRWIEDGSFCYHDPDAILPKADVSLGHLLMLHNDEARFLAEATHTPREHMGWNGDWLRHVRRRRRREAELATGHVPAERLTAIAREADEDYLYYETRLDEAMGRVAAMDRAAAIPA